MNTNGSPERICRPPRRFLRTPVGDAIWYTPGEREDADCRPDDREG